MITTLALARDTFSSDLRLEVEVETLRRAKRLLQAIYKKQLTLIVDPNGRIGLTGSKESIKQFFQEKPGNDQRTAAANRAKQETRALFEAIKSDPHRYTIESRHIVGAKLDIDLLKTLCDMGGPDSIVCSQAHYSKLEKRLGNKLISLPDFPTESFRELIEARTDSNVWHLDELTSEQFGQLLKPVFNCAKHICIYDYVIGRLAAGPNPGGLERFAQGIHWLMKQWAKAGDYFKKEELRIYTGVRAQGGKKKVVENIEKYFLKGLKVKGISISVYIRDIGGLDEQHLIHERYFQACASRQFSTVVLKFNGFDFISEKPGRPYIFNKYEVTKLGGRRDMLKMDARLQAYRRLKNYCEPIGASQ